MHYSRPPRATLAQVAKASEVSTATVARVLSKRGYVAEATRVRVEQVLAETGYRPNAVARGLRTQRTRTLGLLLSSIGVNPMFAQIARAVEDGAVRKGYQVLIVNLEADAGREHAAVLRLIESRVDAMIFNHAVAAENVAIACAAGIPVVQVERLINVPTALVVVDNTIGCEAAMAHLLGLGHRRIGFIGADPARYGHAGPRAQSIEAERLGSYRDGLAKAGVAFDPTLITLGRYPLLMAQNSAEPAPGYVQMQRLLALPVPPTAVFVTSDLLATGVLQAIYAAGLHVPRDISVIGYDDNLAPLLTPPLTAVAMPNQETGNAALRLALAAIAGTPGEMVVTVPTRLVVRRSTAPPPL